MAAGSDTSGAVFEARIVLRNSRDALDRLADFTRGFSADAGLPRECAFALDLVLTEWVTNVLSYGFRTSEEGRIFVRVSTTGSDLRVEVEDTAAPFDPLARPEVDTGAPMEEKPIGGLGIHLIKKFMDTVSYARRDQRNALTMSKRLRGEPAPSEVATP